MAIWLDAAAPDFEERFKALLSTKREVSADVGTVVDAIIDDVRERGDTALAAYSKRFDEVDFDEPATPMKVSEGEVAQAFSEVDPKVVEALKVAEARIRSHHARQLPENDFYKDEIGVGLGHRWTAVEAVGLYVPGGTASYPSSVLMNAVPASVAGVERIVMVVPAMKGKVNPAVLAAAQIAGVSEIYRIGGAQAVAALAHGTESIKPVSKIVGPGNAYVAAAKRAVFGTVGIDMIAGPSEVLIIADGENNPDWIAADLLAQAEHDTAAQSILITTDKSLGKAVEEAVERQLKTLPRGEIAGASWRDYGAIITVPDIETAMPLANRIAPEHLELAVDDPDALIPKVRNAGAIFAGHYTPEAIGDYVGGSNHVLPTARSARFSSGLTVLDFMKRTSILRLGPEQLNRLAPPAIELAECEGLGAHARSVSIRLNRKE
ncbi:histidinol dehydrogenase [Martelella mediterranea]|uniref:Histidinol dehydrogenase n=1 Tax=Martelella mediterranea TaxID=293089 RepID=A0A4R3NRZ8_9HYPH|nr:histidinol dehydrogenase [Martelella mediterranea]TCT39566.1 histidinol dehydrogenase [Martelella mediterranea]